MATASSMPTTTARPTRTRCRRTPTATSSRTPPSTSSDDTTWINSDTAGDACDTDDDNDGLTDAAEAVGCNGSGPLNPLVRDTDGDRFLDGAECARAANPGSAASTPTARLLRHHRRSGRRPPLQPRRDLLHELKPQQRRHRRGRRHQRRKDGCEAASLNIDRVVNSARPAAARARRSSRVLGGGTPMTNFDINKDGNINSADQVIVGDSSSPAGPVPVARSGCGRDGSPRRSLGDA